MSDTINVYWAPLNETHPQIDKSMWYLDPENVYKRHTNNKNTDMKDYATLFTCPAIQKKLINTWSFPNAIDTKIVISDAVVTEHKGMPLRPTPRVNSIADTGHLWLDLSWLFFSEEPLVAEFTSAYFDKTSYANYMSIPPAAFDIGQWFRPFNSEYIVWEPNSCEINIPRGEQLFYITLLTDKKINFVRFEATEKIIKYASGCAKSTDFFGAGKGLDNRYSYFNDGHMRELVLRELKNNIIDTQGGDR